MAHSKNPSVWVEKRRTAAGFTKYRVRAEADGQRLPAGPWTPKKTWADEEAAKTSARLWAGEREGATRRRVMTWDTFFASHESARKKTVPETWDRFDRHALSSFTEAGGARGKFLQAISKPDVEAWVSALMDGDEDEAYSPTTVRMWFRCLRTAFNSAIASGLMKTNPCHGVSLPNESGGGRALRDAELVAIFDKARPELLRAGQWALNTGPRIGEVVALDWSMVEDGPGGSWFARIPAHLRKARQKVKKDCRFPINVAARAWMGPRRASGLVFPYSDQLLQHQFAAARSEAGIPRASFHWLRHTFATRYLANGGRMEDLLETKLWADYRSLLRYVHLDDETLVKRFEMIILPPPSPRK